MAARKRMVQAGSPRSSSGQDRKQMIGLKELHVIAIMHAPHPFQLGLEHAELRVGQVSRSLRTPSLTLCLLLALQEGVQGRAVFRCHHLWDKPASASGHGRRLPSCRSSSGERTWTETYTWP